MKDGKKVGGTKEVWFPKECTCMAWGIWECRCAAIKFEAFVGGGKIGTYPKQTAAKIAVEKHLGLSTMKPKVIQPKLIDQKGPGLEARKRKEYKKWLAAFSRKNRKK